MDEQEDNSLTRLLDADDRLSWTEIFYGMTEMSSASVKVLLGFELLFACDSFHV